MRARRCGCALLACGCLIAGTNPPFRATATERDIAVRLLPENSKHGPERRVHQSKQ